MTRTALRSAVLEVGLFYEKGWSPERIARFTFRLQRRRRRAAEAAAHRGHNGNGREAEWLAVPFLIGAGPDPWVAYDVAPTNGEGVTLGPRDEVLAGRQPDDSGRRVESNADRHSGTSRMTPATEG
jgi:hypothetical protein